MESNTPAVTRPRLYGIVHHYIKTQLPRNIHPAFKALRDREVPSSNDTALHSQVQTPRIDAVSGSGGGDEDADDDFPLYAVLSIPMFFCD